ncbi:MAG: NUDIX hydrolase [Sulfitobacter sp.]
MGQAQTFGGAKVALFLGQQLVVILRDEKPGLPYPGHWDFPGGGREGPETAFECMARECAEELGLTLRGEDVMWSRSFETEDGVNWFFVAQLPESAVHGIVFGKEGQRWQLMGVGEYLDHPKAIQRFKDRLRVALDGGLRGFSQESPPLP